MEFPERLKALRTAAGINQIEFAEAVGVLQKDVSRWENGVYTPSMDKIIKICKALDVSADVLLGLKER